MEGPGLVYETFVADEFKRMHIPALSQAQSEKLWAMTGQLQDGKISIELWYKRIRIGDCKKGRWRWNTTSMEKLDKETRLREKDLSAWQRFDYIWAKVTNNLCWFVQSGSWQCDYSYSGGAEDWTLQGEQIGKDFLWVILTLSTYAWVDGSCMVSPVDLKLLI